MQENSRVTIEPPGYVGTRRRRSSLVARRSSLVARVSPPWFRDSSTPLHSSLLLHGYHPALPSLRLRLGWGYRSLRPVSRVLFPRVRRETRTRGTLSRRIKRRKASFAFLPFGSLLSLSLSLTRSLSLVSALFPPRYPLLRRD